MSSFSRGTLGTLGTEVCRLGLSASYRPGKRTIHRALDAGINYFFCFGIDSQMIRTLREVLPRERERFVVAAGAYNYIWGHQNMKNALEKRLRQLRTDYIDLFHFLGVARGDQFNSQVRDELAALRADSRVRGISISTHDRKLAGQLAAEGALDGMMIRYNAAHRGAEQEIFPHLAAHDPAIISFTATRWRYLLRRPRVWPKDRPVPTAAMCYRFVLSNPNVDVCLTAPSNLRQFDENIKALEQGPLTGDEMCFMREFGDVVHRRAGWFM
jgi:aryl-alcohol dehydrogenase-like predicted oxidoreductase